MDVMMRKPSKMKKITGEPRCTETCKPGSEGGDWKSADIGNSLVAYPTMRILTDRGTEYCGAREHHEYSLYLTVEDIDHSKTKAKSPQTNGICERFHKTIEDEFYATAFRKKLYGSLEEIQQDLDKWLEEYNLNRTHQGKYCYGKTPMRTWLDSLHLAKIKMLEQRASA
jgi:transposase InsO family protein